MADNAPLSAEQISHALQQWLEVEFTFIQVDDLAAAIAALPREDQDFLLGWVRRIATTNIQIAHQFALRAISQLARMDRRMIEAWALHAMDTFDRAGSRPAFKVINELDSFARLSHEHAAGALFEEVGGILLNFVRGLSGRHLKLEKGEATYTDSETLFLPAVVAQMREAADNFKLCKAMVALLWAQTRFGTFRVNLTEALNTYPDIDKALKQFHALETLRLEACIGRELPGLYREMQRLKTETGVNLPAGWELHAADLARPEASVADSLRLVERVYPDPTADAVCYQGELRLDAVAASIAARVEREKILLRIKLAQELEKQTIETRRDAPHFDVRQVADDRNDLPRLEITLEDAPIAPPEGVNQLLTSIYLDLGEIPPEYLVPAGPGEYDPSLLEEKTQDPDTVWQGTYHEEGASLYPEWDFGRQHYRKNWCVLREKAVTPLNDGFTQRTLDKHSGLVKHLRRTFEAMRDENRLLKREPSGDEVDIDALIEALADARDGSEMSDRLFMRTHRSERNIAVMFMVDMSGSTKGWINDAERESLVLLCETLELLGDRYAIYGFSGITRKRCEIFRVKSFDEPYGEIVQQRIAGISPQEYTRMGVAIRHLSAILNEVDARTKLLITLSDGKPDDYHDGYRGQYGIEDTRMALIEAKRSGIHPFCITIDTEGRDYLPHMYGAVNYTVIADVKELPLKVADIYRRLTR
ncbi:nitric oxide reductase activation protein [Sulfuricella sp.]|uniref:nitric oxide reductase activation protein NorD n=1 Tax=Sulfuricella sp. TaxID=2099377 RepID=UPI002B57D3ED|nr:nitric oxide reductase activation protein [Sulfuricella sp.]HUX63576.1 nitric oxide reductase activation protein [Sulfuricella sp.]